MAKNFLFDDEIIYYNFKGMNIMDLESLVYLPSCLQMNFHFEVFISNIRIIFCLLTKEEDVCGIFYHNISSVSKVKFFVNKNGGQRVCFISGDKYYNMQISEKSVDRIKEFLNINNSIEEALA